ncbi:MAG: phosphatase PAP2 family protein [Spirochaetia bacterium]|nr:phosphatase PAP2 family protein [Spirochaetia bacterium]
MKIKSYYMFFFVFIIGFFIIYFYNNQIFLAINGFLPDIMGYPMLLLTSLADGFFVLMFLSLYYPYRKSKYTTALISLIVTGAIIQLIKNYIPMPRPLKVFDAEDIFILGLKIKTKSFPSGHSAAAMVLTVYLTQIKDINYKIFYFILGILACISRVYIGVHFPIDIWVGGWMGFSFTYFLYYINNKNKLNLLNKISKKENKIFIDITGITIILVYLFFYTEKTKQLEFILTPLVILLFFYFFYRIYINYKEVVFNGKIK